MNVPLAILVEYGCPSPSSAAEALMPDVLLRAWRGKLLIRVFNEEDGLVYLYEFGHREGAQPELGQITRVGRPSEAELAIVAALRSAPIVDTDGVVYSWDSPPGTDFLKAIVE